MKPKPEMKSKTNPILASILKQYVGADSVGADSVISSQTPHEPGGGGSDWYNMTCPYCPWFVDGAKTGLYAVVGGDKDKACNGAPTAGKDANGDSGRVVVRRTPIVRCERPETVECLSDSLCVRLLVASKLIRQQAAVEKMANEIDGSFAHEIFGTEENRRRVVADANRKRNQKHIKLRRSSRRRGR